jgi:hypothetical protein
MEIHPNTYRITGDVLLVSSYRIHRWICVDDPIRNQCQEDSSIIGRAGVIRKRKQEEQEWEYETRRRRRSGRGGFRH